MQCANTALLYEHLTRVELRESKIESQTKAAFKDDATFREFMGELPHKEMEFQLIKSCLRTKDYEEMGKKIESYFLEYCEGLASE